MGEQGREFPSFVQAWAQDSRDLLDQGLGSQEGIVLLSCKEASRELRMDPALMRDSAENMQLPPADKSNIPWVPPELEPVLPIFEE